MYSMTDLANECRDLIDAKLADGQTIKLAWATQEIMNNHPRIAGTDRSFHLCCSRATVWECMRKQANRYKLKPEKHLQSDRQIVLPGFEYLQMAYAIDQDGDQVIMPISKISSEQLLAKAVELYKMGDGCAQHAREIERYVTLAA